MLLGDNVAGLRCELAADFATPGSILEGFTLPAPPLNRHDVLPCFVIPGTVTTMHRVEDTQPCATRTIQDSQHVRNALVGFGHSLNAIPDLAALGNEIVVRIDHQECSDRRVKLQISHVCCS